ncbi:MAG: response regulator [Candidatus Schekmanbacteria bacterium]|nr:response regulator [Candidatus Schekmanbacteria bacterium]
MGKKILLVEDNSKNLRLIKLLLKGKGYDLIEAADGPSGLKKALQEKPDLIVMDIQLPGISGLDITRRLRNTPGFETIPIIAMTAHAMKGEPEEILEAGCNVYLSKPINTREFPQEIEYWLNISPKND